ncbi:MAG TPA: adenylate/guanylate cyclase domain-containing protein [Acidimicrobiales bacterium]|nr:adenylate/guanylate cyclase domain-containing protein [Acidimicrobiales bacterium]
MTAGTARGTGIGTEDGEIATLTVLFTDIVGSTALTERLGDARWVQVLSAHDVIVRRVLRVHGGRELKTVGDGFMAVFANAAAAVRAGIDVQRLVRTIRIPEIRGSLRVRVGAHAGPVVCRGGDVLGHNVNVARRIVCAADPGQVLVSSAVKILAEPYADVCAGPVRSLHLRGVAEPVAVYAMAVEERRLGGTLHVLHPLHPAGWGLELEPA